MKRTFFLFIIFCLVALSSCTSPNKKSLSSRESSKPLSTLYAVGDIDQFDQRLAPLAKKIVKEDPNGHWLILGDGGYGSSKDVTENYDEILDVINKKNISFIIGDHDYGTQDPTDFDDRHLDSTQVKNIFDTTDVFSLRLAHGSWDLIGVNDNCVESSNPDANACNRRINSFDKKLADSTTQCQIATWHHPIYAVLKQGGSDQIGSKEYGVPLYQAAFDNNVDIILNGDHHHFLASKNVGRTGRVVKNPSVHHVRQFIVGTGGAPLSINYNTPKLKENAVDKDIRSQVGVARLDLYSDHANVSFITMQGVRYTTRVDCY